MKLPVSIYPMFLSFILGLISSLNKKNRGKIFSIFPFFLFITLSVELYGIYLTDINKNTSTVLLYNLFTTLEFTFYSWMLREIIINKTIKKVILFVLFFYPFISLVNIFFIQGKSGFHTVTYAIGCLLIVTWCIYYFYELFLLAHSVRLLKQSSFWICTALLFFYTFSFPIYGLSNLMMGLPKVVLRNLESIVDIINVFLYLLFSIAFLCRIKMPKLSRS